MQYDENISVDFKLQSNITKCGCNLEGLRDEIMNAIASAIYEEDFVFGVDIQERLSLKSLKINFEDKQAVVYTSIEGNYVEIPFIFRWDLK